ncbi:EF-hand domain-containing protein 1-like [Aricia agestis]|uniref:EF-hand domain-containing protein 1-like n=1 Tax=Aricia agestis TaxID=91739 RepID=UPI001C203760|nr:EF-hand domain-containing protein 1-like [Aricia agestis]XP_041973573.1 EF-hand domain-containing protein 1-like [Aricia agestis]XP_041973574.1 EF-hand domain-containing protein 1-like [Aricia agestis]
MAWGLPKLPGYTFSDPTRGSHHLRSSMRFYHGYMMPDTLVRGPGGTDTDVDSNAFALADDSLNYDPSLTYGRVKQSAPPAVIPHWVHYNKRCLNFTAFFKQPVFDDPLENYRVRVVNIIYFLEDDTLTVIEPKIRNSGLWQGKLVKRGRIPKNDLGDPWHWKDLDIGKDICIYGKVFHTVSCDLYTREWLESQGIELSKEEELPEDAYTQKERWKMVKPPQKARTHDDPVRRFLEYDGKVLTFNVVWDDRDSAFGELAEYKLFYYLQDDTIAIKQLHDGRGGKDPFPMLLTKRKVPKKWKERPVDFPSILLETSDAEVTEYYSPRDLIVGQTLYILGRRFLIFDCDQFTRKYYKTMLNIEQPERIEVKTETKREIPKSLPPHIGIGTPEDTLQSCFGLIPKPPQKDIIKYNLNANKYLRYLCELDWIHPEDKDRQFVLKYSLADGTVKIGEIPRRNSGIREGTFLQSMRLQTPESDPNFPTYYTPDRFYIGAVIPVFKHRFRITGCDLFVYRYMSANPHKFPRDVIDNVRNYHVRQGNLREELEEATRDEIARETRAQLAKIGQSAVADPDSVQRCLTELNVVEGEAAPPRTPTPPTTTDQITYDDALRVARAGKLGNDEVIPLKGILKSGTATDEHQKVVCFTAPAPRDHDDAASLDARPRYDEAKDFCDRYKDPEAEQRAERRAKDICAYDIIPADRTEYGDDDVGRENSLPGYLGTYNVDCKQVPEYMRLNPDDYDKVKTMRQDVPEISPAAARRAHLPRVDLPDDCQQPDSKNPEDVTFGCHRVAPKFQDGCE